MWNKILILAALSALTSCGGPAAKKAAETRAETVDMHNAENSLDYLGIYKGTIPAADCPGIEMRLVLYNDGKFQLSMEYLERDSSFSDKGTYTVTGNLLTLTPEEGQPTFYKIEEGQVRMLNAEKQPAEGALADHYTLKKAQ